LIVPQAKKNTNDTKRHSGYFSNIDEWPNDWMGVEEDLEIGRGLLAFARQNVFGIHFHSDFQRSVEHPVHVRLQDHDLT
jgi:hypothetical protein